MTSTEKTKMAGQRSQETHDQQIEAAVSDTLSIINELTIKARNELITWEERARRIAGITGDNPKIWMPKNKRARGKNTDIELTNERDQSNGDV